MAAERTESTAFLAGPLARVTALAVLFPRLTLIMAVLSAVAAAWLGARGLGFKTARQDLVAPDSEAQRAWQAYVDEFGEEEDAVVVAEGRDPAAIERALDDLAARVTSEPSLFHAVFHRVDLSQLRAKGLHYLAPAELVALDQFLAAAVPIVGGDWSRLKLVSLLAETRQRLEAENQQGIHRSPTDAEATRLATGLLRATRGQAGYESPWPAGPAGLTALDRLGSTTLSARDGQYGFLLVRLTMSADDGFTRGARAVGALRAAIDVIARRHPGVRLGLTGLPVMEFDEMYSSQQSTIWASGLSLVGVSLLVVAGFGGLRHALLVNLVLLVGIAWSFGYAALAVGHLNILSMTFTVTLIGIGVDYGIHFVARYLQYREQGDAPSLALVATGRSISPAIVTGAVTTAVAFLAAGTSSFLGIAELGIIAGGGILLCAVAELVVLPAAVVLVDRSRVGRRLPVPLPMHLWFAPLARAPGAVLGLGLVISATCAIGLTWLWYDHNLLNLQAESLESVLLEKRLSRDCGQSLWYALSVADTRDELLERQAAFEKLASVERTEEVASLLPPEDSARPPLVAQIHDRLRNLPQQPPLVPLDTPAALAGELLAWQTVLAQRPAGSKIWTVWGEVTQRLGQLPAGQWYQRASTLQQQLAADLLSQLQSLAAVSDPEPPHWADLPSGLTERFHGRTGRHLLKVYGRGEIWDMAVLERFVSEVARVDPKVTGNPLQAYSASWDLQRSYQRAAWYALAVIVAVLVFDFRSVPQALLAGLPLGLGMVQAFGLLGWWGCPLNPANMIALPILLGIGVDYGVHIVHDFREQQGEYRLSPSVSVAVVVDSLTTIVGFGSLMVADHRGLQSLGRVLVVGVGCCLLTSTLLLPAALMLMSRRRETPPSDVVPLAHAAREGPPEPHLGVEAFADRALVVPRRTTR